MWLLGLSFYCQSLPQWLKDVILDIVLGIFASKQATWKQKVGYIYIFANHFSPALVDFSYLRLNVDKGQHEQRRFQTNLLH